MWTSSNRRIAVATAAVVALATAGPSEMLALGLASEPAASGASSASAARTAVALTRDRGVPTLLIVTSSRVPSSSEFARHFLQGDWARQHRGLVRILELSAEDDPELVSAIGVARFPTAVVYLLGASGLVRHETAEGCSSVSALGDWLGDLSASASASVPDEGPRVDPQVMRASTGGKSLPSPQGYSPPTVQAGPPASPPTAVPQFSPPTMMGMAPQMATGMANVISVPGQNFVIQQQSPQIFMAPAQAPVVYVPQQQQQPQMMMMAGAPTAASAPNLFLPAAPATMMAAPQPTMMAMAAPQPTMAVAAAPQPTMAVATASQPTQLAAVSNQQLNLPTSASRSRVRVRGPGFFASSLARFGERLTRLGRIRIVSEQETTLEAPLSQAGTPGMTTISTTSAVPMASAPQPPVAVPIPAPCPTPHPGVDVPCPPLPTPQDSHRPHPHQ